MCIKTCHSADIVDLQWWIIGLVGVFVVTIVAITRTGPLISASLPSRVASPLQETMPTSAPVTDSLDSARWIAQQTEHVLERSPDDTFQLWQATELCNVSTSVGSHSRSEVPEIAGSQSRALDRMLEWCDIALGGLNAESDPNRLARQALAAGSLIAEAHDLVRIDLYEGPEYARALARDFLSMRDPQILLAVTTYIVDRPAGYDPNLAGLDLHLLSASARATLFEYASELVACRLGADCSATSPKMLRLCLYNAHCDRDFVTVLREDMLSPRDFQRTTLLADALHEGLHTGDFTLFDL